MVEKAESADYCDPNVDDIMKGFENCLFQYQMAVVDNVESFKKMLFENPEEAVKQIVSVFDKTTSQAYTDDDDGWNMRGYISAMAGGLHEGSKWLLYNAVGAVYPMLSREAKDTALTHLFSIWDSINYMYVNGSRSTGDTPGIRGPLLLADIAIARPIYWPGLDEGNTIIKKYDTFEQINEEFILENGIFNPGKIDSDFLVAWALLKSEFGEEYRKVAEPLFLGRTVQGIIAVHFGYCRPKPGRMAELKEELPEALHEHLEPLREKADWVDAAKFGREY